VEVVILAPVFLGLIALAVLAGRTAVARYAVEMAAHDAARAASIARTADGAVADGQTAVEAALAAQGLDCAPAASVTLVGRLSNGATVSIQDTFDPDVVPLGTAVFVVATVACDVSFDDLGVPGVFDSIAVETTFVSPLDRYRSKTTAAGGAP
jgi:Flp pilus assembly protein TadG